MVTSYQACCPDSQIVLLGYSQGAQVTADFLCGRSSAGFPPTPAYAPLVADAVSAIVLMGDPTFVKAQSWDRGNASNVSVCILPFFFLSRQLFCRFVNHPNLVTLVTCPLSLPLRLLPVSSALTPALTGSFETLHTVLPSPRQRSMRARGGAIHQLLRCE